MPESAGTLYIVATPIGNMEDLSPRARRILESVDAILCEDTRHTGQLLARWGVGTRRVSLHEHNEAQRVPEVIDGLKAGRNFALVADAGTPLISDPGYRLVAAARQENLTVSPVPGPCAAIAALSVAGLPADRFCFEGFLPARAAARRARLDALADESRTLVFYESGRRLDETIRDCVEVFGADRDAAVAREMTKAFEALYRGTLGDLERALGEDEYASRGECVLLVAGAARQSETGPEVGKAVRILLEFMSPSQAARIVSRIYGIPRQKAYRIAAGKPEPRESDPV